MSNESMPLYECEDELEFIKRNLKTHFSFVYFQGVISIFVVLLMIPFVFRIVKKRKSILKYHDTISSFCAQKAGWENRWLLIFTLVISANMLCMKFDEYNSRYWNTDLKQRIDLFIIFLFECICIILFPFVGIFYTRGKHPLEENEDFECPCANCTIKTSEKLHRCGAYTFLLGLCCTSIVWTTWFVQLTGSKNSIYAKYYGLWLFLLIWAVLQLVSGIVFVVLQIVLKTNYRIKEAFLPGQVFRQRTNLDLELSTMDINSEDTMRLRETKQSLRRINESTSSDEDIIEDYKHFDGKIGTNQTKYRFLATKLRYVSFAIECIVAGSVIALDAVITTAKIVDNLHIIQSL